MIHTSNSHANILTASKSNFYNMTRVNKQRRSPGLGVLIGLVHVAFGGLLAGGRSGHSGSPPSFRYAAWAARGGGGAES
jgi:hypothetical protein